MLGLGWQELIMLVIVIVLVGGFFGIGSLGRQARRSLGPESELPEPSPLSPAALRQMTATSGQPTSAPAPDAWPERPENV